MKIRKTRQEQFQIDKPRFNLYQVGHGEIKSEKYKSRKSKSGQRIKILLKNFENA